jgi:hypothetical protein
VATAPVVEQTFPVTVPLNPGPGRPANPPTASAPATSETVAATDGGWHYAYSQWARTLSPFVDQIESDFGADLYERMADTDPQVSSSLDILVLLSTSQPVEVGPGGAEKGSPEYALALKYRDFVRANLARLPHPLQATLYELEWGAKVRGHKYAEIVYELATIDPLAGPQILLKALKPRPQQAYRIVVDGYNNLLGLLPLQPNAATFYGQALTQDLADLLAPPNKFLKRINHSRNNDPRGTSELRDVYNIWWMGVQNWSLLLAGMTQFATPSVALVDAPAGTVTWTDDSGNPTTDAHSITAQGIKVAQAYRSGSALYLANGQELKIFAANDASAACVAFRKMVNLEIAKAITNQTLATDQSEHQPKASSSVHQDVLALKPRQNKFEIAHMLERELFAPLLELNFGPAALQYLPRALIGQTQVWNLAAVGQMFAQLAANNMITPSMKPGINAGLELPEMTQAEQEADAAFWLAQHDPKNAAPQPQIGNSNA